MSMYNLEKYPYKCALTIFDHWLTEEEAYEQIKIFDPEDKKERDQYILQEKKILKFFKAVYKKYGLKAGAETKNLICSKRSLMREARKALREKHTLNLFPTNNSFVFQTGYDLTVKVGSIFDPKNSELETLVSNFGLYLLA